MSVPYDSAYLRIPVLRRLGTPAIKAAIFFLVSSSTSAKPNSTNESSMLLATIDFSKIISDLAPILSAAVTGIGTYFLTRNNNGDKLSQREYDYITQERNRIQVLINDEITQIRKDKDELRTELIEIRNKLTELEKVEDECQLKLHQAQVIITQLRNHNTSNMS